MTGVLSGAQLALLGAIQDRLVPNAGAVPGAGELGCAARVDEYLAERPGLRLALLGILQAIEIEAAAAREIAAPQAIEGERAGGREASEGADDDTRPVFLALRPEQRDAVLRAVEVSAPVGFRALVRQTYNAYYTHPVVQAAVGNTSPTPQPGGFPVERFDAARLARVKAAGRRWRDA
jgi:hypothetical protein